MLKIDDVLSCWYSVYYMDIMSSLGFSLYFTNRFKNDVSTKKNWNRLKIFEYLIYLGLECSGVWMRY